MSPQIFPIGRPTTPAVHTRETGDWRTRAACRHEDPELFFPVGHSAEAQAQTEFAKWVCTRCPVRAECLGWALEMGMSGVWGGLSEDERAGLGVPETSQFVRCLGQQQLIEARLGSGVSHRRIADELGVSRTPLRRAIACFKQERAQLDAAALDAVAEGVSA